MLKKILAVLAMLYAAAAFAAVDVNKASAAELDGVKGIGPATSKSILDERKKGAFKDWGDLIERVKGIGDTNAAKFSEAGLTVNGAAYKPAAAAAKDDKKAAKDDKKDAKAAAKEEKKDDKKAAKEEKKDAKATAKEEKKEDKKAAKEEKKDEKAATKDAKPAASGAKPAASGAKPAASAKK